VRGDIHQVHLPSGGGHRQHGPRYAVVLQSDDLYLSTYLVAPTSTSQAPAQTVFRPEIVVDGQVTRVLCEQTTPLDAQRLGAQVGTVSRAELAKIDQALRLLFGLR
jgi:mRNA interferase MazF